MAGNARHFFPQPRIELGRGLRELRIPTAMIDTSDGLSTDLSHICDESGVGAEIEAAHIPRARVGKPGRKIELELALHGGEDYELLFTVSPRTLVPAELARVPLTEIGKITRAGRIVVRDENGSVRKLDTRGWEHFRRR
jgi:thiamine-monophosphate kinase